MAKRFWLTVPCIISHKLRKTIILRCANVFSGYYRKYTDRSKHARSYVPNVRENVFGFAKTVLGQIDQFMVLCKCKKVFSFRGPLMRRSATGPR